MIPHAAMLNMEVLDMGDARARFRLPYDEQLIGDPLRRTLHGGVITTLMDNTAGAAVWAAKARPQGTLDLRIDYLRAAEPGLSLIAEAHCYRLCTHVAFVRGECHDGSARRPAPVAQMNAVFALSQRSEHGPFAGEP
jgi:uncharacterized protein (TIGR00369 family)